MTSIQTLAYNDAKLAMELTYGLNPRLEEQKVNRAHIQLNKLMIIEALEDDLTYSYYTDAQRAELSGVLSDINN